ncbi:MAG: TIGR02594 family protein [Rhodobacteraceae bacterium]|nr:TIGR02594 family protein [Paracoccaceae bacterium]MCW9041724.1 TIGR02594 family protein [Pseudopelagicola sp.]
MRHVYQLARQHLGLKEWPGAKHNPEIVEMFAEVGHDWVQDDETPWCAAFVGAVLGQAGLRGTGKLNARSYESWGEKVALEDAEPGDVVVFWRESPESWKGHVGFFVSEDSSGDIHVLGGNQGDAVSVEPYSDERFLSVRRAKAPRKTQLLSTTHQAATAGQLGNALTAWQVVPQLDAELQPFALAGFVLVALALLWVSRERSRKWLAGDR